MVRLDLLVTQDLLDLLVIQDLLETLARLVILG